jgi:hypothetical protein
MSLDETLEKVRAHADKGEVKELLAIWKSEGDDEVKDEVEDSLALARTEDALAAVLDIVAKGRGSHPLPDHRVRAIASRLAFTRGKDDLAAVAKRIASTELLASWLQELVLRGERLDGDAAMKDVVKTLADKKHPLAGWPLRLHASEAEAPTYMPMYGEASIDTAVARLEKGPQSVRTMPPPAEHASPTATETTDGKIGARLASAVVPWTVSAKARSEARTFSLSVKLDGFGLGRWLLRQLPLESAKEGPGSALRVARVEAEAVWGMLFAAAANGGARTPGAGGAHARPIAWSAFGALVGAPPDATPDRIDEIAAEAAFLSYGGTAFFHDVAWDIGLLCLRPDGMSVAVLAATDTD